MSARSRHRRAHPHGLRARVAADPGDDISDFKFTPATLTIHVGDTVSWTNSGPSPHTATAKDGSFNTGILKKGQSASHTFTRAGTYAYVCQIHPFMHGTIVVLASTASSQPSSTQSSASATSTSTSSGPSAQASAASTPSLPVTGLNLVAALLVAAALLSAGIALRIRVRRH